MTQGQPRLRTLVRLVLAGCVIFGAWGIGMVSTFWLLGMRDGPSETRRVEEAELRPGRAHFRPLDGPAPQVARTSLTYVPVYSTLYIGDGYAQVGFAVTLSLRNTSPDRDLVVHRVDYYDTAGVLAQRLADRSHAIPPMATAEFFIDRRDPTGGPGANYLIEWSIPEGGTEPLIEAVMVGRFGSAGKTVVSRGQVIRASIDRNSETGSD